MFGTFLSGGVTFVFEADRCGGFVPEATTASQLQGNSNFARGPVPVRISHFLREYSRFTLVASQSPVL